MPFMNLYKSQLEKLGHNVDTYFFKGNRDIKNYYNAIRYIRNIVSHDFDIIHAFFGSSGFVANFQRDIPVITTFIGSDLLGEYKKNGHYDYFFSIITFLTSFFAQIFSERITTISKQLSQRIYFKNKHSLIKLGVDAEHFAPMKMIEARRLLNWDNDIFYILFPAMRNRAIKRYSIAKKIINQISNDIKKVKLISLDKPNMYPKMPTIMNACNAMIFVSIHEGSPNVIKEAMACNLPVFSFDIGDVKETCKDVRPGFISQYDDVVCLHEKLGSYLSHNPNRRSNGRDIIKSRSWNKHIIEVEKTYFEALRIKTNES